MQFPLLRPFEGQPIIEYCGVVTGEAIRRQRIPGRFFASIRDIVRRSFRRS